jgi:hypothetical protein
MRRDRGPGRLVSPEKEDLVGVVDPALTVIRRAQLPRVETVPSTEVERLGQLARVGRYNSF